MNLKSWQGRLVWKLMASYVIVIVVGVVTLAVAVESVIPTAFNRHMLGMQQMMSSEGEPVNIADMRADLFTNFRAAVTEALLVSTVAVLVCVIVVSFFISQRVVNPIRQMMRASYRIAAGHYQERVEVVSEDELGQLAHSFNQMAATLEETETMRRDLIANVAHELRTPLASIKGYMEGLMDNVLPTEPATFQQIYREADRLQRLVNDLQELSQVEAGAFKLDCRPVVVTDLIRQIAIRLQPQFEEKGVAFHLNLPDHLPTVMADEDRLSQVLLNLIGNALQYTPPHGAVTITAGLQKVTTSGENPVNPPEAIGQAKTKITAQTQKRSEELFVTVGDTGIGIPAEYLPHLFTRFYRVDKSRSRTSGGSGIGLTIAKHLIEAHRGHIWAESAGAGRGSLFGFSLSLA